MSTAQSKKDVTVDSGFDIKKSRHIKIGKDKFTIVSVFIGDKTSSELVYEAAVKRILHGEKVR